MCRRLVAMAAAYAERLGGRTVAPPTQRTACLITYGDGIRRAGETPLHTLSGFLHDHVGDLVSDVHLLPMFPWTSDDGFAVVDHRAVNPALGTWDDVAEMAGEHDLMFDFVANHTSSSSPWFTGWLAGDPAYAGFYVERDPDFDVSHVTRPRTTPLFHAVPAPGRHDGRGLDDVRRGPGRRRRPPPRDAARAHRRAARLPRARRVRGPARRHRLPLEGVGHHLHPPAADARGDQAVAGAGRPRRPRGAAADRDQRAARREHLLLRQRRGRGAPGLPVRAAAAGAALVRGRLDRTAQPTGRRAWVR